MMAEDAYEKEFLKPIIKWGMITNLGAALLVFLPPIYLASLGIIPPIDAIAGGAILIISTAGAYWFVEPISYYSILGIPGTYMSFLAGNISNLRLPCSAVAQAVVGVKEGTRQAEVVATVAIAASIIVNTSLLTIGVFGGAAALAAAPPIVKEAFKYILPAIFGAIFGQFALRDPKLAAIALPLAIILVLAKLPAWLAILISVFTMIGIARYYYGKKLAEKSKQ